MLDRLTHRVHIIEANGESLSPPRQPATHETKTKGYVEELNIDAPDGPG